MMDRLDTFITSTRLFGDGMEAARGRFRAGRPLFYDRVVSPLAWLCGPGALFFVLGAPPYRGGLEIADHPGLAPPFFIGSDGYG